MGLPAHTLLPMARFSGFLGRAVEVEYRAGDICLPASGTFVGDSGRSIFLEQHFEQQGKPRSFRWELPYQCILRIEEKREAAEPAQARVTIAPSAVKPRALGTAAGAAEEAPPFARSTSHPKIA